MTFEGLVKEGEDPFAPIASALSSLKDWGWSKVHALQENDIASRGFVGSLCGWIPQIECIQ
jgi:hypothetical protein